MTLASIVVWTITAILGLTLLIRVGAISKGPKGRSRKRRVLLTIHVAAAATGLVSWTWYAVTGVWETAALAAVMILVAAAHGLLMVARWSPGYGRHATAERPRRKSGGYFPVHNATAHAMAASSTLTLVVVVILTVRDW